MAEKTGAWDDALECYSAAIAADPTFVRAYMNLGAVHLARGASEDARAAFSRVIDLDARHAAAHYNAGLAWLQQQDHLRAEASFRTALDLAAPFPEAWVGLADALEAQGREADALAALDNAIAQRADYAGALFNASLLLRKTGHLQASVDYRRRALAAEPEHAIEHAQLGADLHELGRFAEAEGSYRAALALAPDLIAAQLALAAVLQAQDRKEEALRVLFDAVAARPHDTNAMTALIEALSGITLLSAGDKERDVLLRLCSDETISMRYFNTAIIGLLKSGEGFRQSSDMALRDEDPFARTSVVVDWLRDPLLCTALRRMPLTDEALERVLTHVRRCLLLRFVAPSGASQDVWGIAMPFVCALAGQCFFSGYALFAEEDELAHVERVTASVEAMLHEPRLDARSVELPLALLATYRYLAGISHAERLLEQPADAFSGAFQPIVREQLENCRLERALAAQIERLTPIADPVSIVVRSQYEEHPYPVWTGLHAVNVETVDALARRLRPDRPLGPRSRRAQILVAGCGTGEQPLQTARTYPDAEILAVDLSLASLAYAARMTQAYGIPNVTYRQADILELRHLVRRFDVVECCGVLHHLRDPLAGWRVLVDAMEPDGLMRIALYSAKARLEWQPAMTFVRSLDLPRSPAGTRRGRHAIMALPDGHPAKAALNCGDFYSLNGCRDLLMHVEEHPFTLPRIADCLARFGLRFLGMQCSAGTRRRFLEMFADPAAAGDLGAWDRFEDAYPSTFQTMYAFWCCRRD